MKAPIDQNIDEKIHRFMARKSDLKTFSKTIAERITPYVTTTAKSAAGISYEQLKWKKHTTI